MLERLRNWARRIKRDVIALYLAARAPDTPWLVKALALAVAGYALSPIDLIPDFIPVLGLLDEVILLPIAISVIVAMIPPDKMARFRADADLITERPTSRIAAALILTVWIVVAAWGLWAAFRMWR